MSGTLFGGKRSVGRAAALSLVAVAAALAVVAAGALWMPSGGEGTGEASPSSTAARAGSSGTVSSERSASTARGIDVVGADAVAAIGGDAEGFAEALSSYLASAGVVARSAAVVADPADPDGDTFYANAGGQWYACEVTDGASGWAFSPLGEEQPFPAAEPDDPTARGARAVDGGAARSEPEAADAGPSGDGGGWVAVSDSPALVRALGAEAASQLAEAMAGYAATKGIGFDLAAARVDASSVRAEPGGVGFVVDTGTNQLDVVYADGGYGFKIL